MRATIAKGCRALATALVLAGTALAQEPPSPVGNWFAEDSDWFGKLDGREYNSYRWLRINRPDGTEKVIFHYYLDGFVVGEHLQEGRWGFKDGVYWSTCESMTVNRKPRKCNSRSEYDVHALDEREMQYTDRGTKLRFRIKRVPDDFPME